MEYPTPSMLIKIEMDAIAARYLLHIRYLSAIYPYKLYFCRINASIGLQFSY